MIVERNLVIEGKYVRLEEVCPKYFPKVIEWRNNPENNRFLNQPFKLTMELQQKWYEEKYLNDLTQGLFIIIDKEKIKKSTRYKEQLLILLQYLFINEKYIAIRADLQRLIEKTAIGQIAAEPASSYFSPMDYFIINARVKGGNSGSPVINEYGKVVGMVFEIPFDSKGGSDSGRYDIMGFGICFPSKYIEELQEEHSTQLLKECQGYFAFND